MKRRLLLSLLFLAALMSASANAPKYIFYFIGDGMGMAPAMAAVAYNRALTGKADLPLMMTFPVAGQVSTYSASSPVTDSAAAGTALATGSKTGNGMLGVTADTIAVISIATILKNNGFGVGLVTNVAPDDATPGAFYAHVPYRGMREEIDRQFVDSRFDFLAGSALNGLTDKDGNPTGVLDLYDANNISVVYGVDGYRSVKDKADRIVLLDKEPFQGGNAGYMIDGRTDMLTLPQMTAVCLEHLQRVSPDRFFMMVEGGNIDHALHGNDAATAISEVFNFNDALRIAYDFMLQHPDETLIVVTADHDTGGLSIGNSPNGYTAHFEVLENQKISKELFSDVCKNILESNEPYSWSDMENYLKEKMGFWDTVKLTDGETSDLEKMFGQVFVAKDADEEKGLYNNFNAFAGRVFEIMSNKAAAGWTTIHHTGNPVPVYSAGVGSTQFGMFQDNTEIPGKILKAAGY